MLSITRQDITPVYKCTVFIHAQDFPSYICIFDFAICSSFLRSVFFLFMSAILIVLDSSYEEQRRQAPIKPIWTLKLDVRYIWVTPMLNMLRCNNFHGNKHGIKRWILGKISSSSFLFSSLSFYYHYNNCYHYNHYYCNYYIRRQYCCRNFSNRL